VATKERVERAGAAGEKSEMKKIGELETMKMANGLSFYGDPIFLFWTN